jgi:hypothetical protein
MQEEVLNAGSELSAFWNVERPPTTTLQASSAARSLAKKHAPVRYSFISRESPQQPDPPLARMLRGGRGGGHVRLRVLLTALWVVRDDGLVSLPLRAWAALAGLDDTGVRGTRRIRDALIWLDEHGFAEVDRAPGLTPQVRLLDDSGNQEPYELPGRAYNRLRQDRASASAHRYVRLPSELWTNGWISVLSGAGLAMLLVLYRELGPRVTRGEQIWISPQLAADRYALSSDTRTKGQRELRNAGLLTITRKPVSADALTPERTRNVLDYNEGALAGRTAELSKFTMERRRTGAS